MEVDQEDGCGFLLPIIEYIPVPQVIVVFIKTLVMSAQRACHAPMLKARCRYSITFDYISDILGMCQTLLRQRS